MPTDECLYDVAELFKLFGDSTRMKILYALFESELCVCHMAQLLGLTQSAVSHQLRLLRNAHLVERVIGAGGVYVLRKFFGIILLAMSVKLFASNLGTLLSAG